MGQDDLEVKFSLVDNGMNFIFPDWRFFSKNDLAFTGLARIVFDINRMLHRQRSRFSRRTNSCYKASIAQEQVVHEDEIAKRLLSSIFLSRSQVNGHPKMQNFALWILLALPVKIPQSSSGSKIPTMSHELSLSSGIINLFVSCNHEIGHGFRCRVPPLGRTCTSAPKRKWII